MATREQRARELVNAGTSRRQTDRVLKAEFGKSIGHEAWGKLHSFVYKVVPKQLVKGGYRHPTTRRQGRYNKLLSWGFTGAEAKELSGATTRLMGSKAIQRMRRERAVLRTSFIRKAHRNGWSESKTKSEWPKAIKKWYKDKGYIQIGKKQSSGKVGLKGQPSPFDWYKDAKQVEGEGDTPRKARRKTQDFVDSRIRQLSGQINARARLMPGADADFRNTLINNNEQDKNEIKQLRERKARKRE